MLSKAFYAALSSGGAGSLVYILNATKDAIVDLGSTIGDSVSKLEDSTLLTPSTIRNAVETAERNASLTLDEVSKTAAKASSMLDLFGAGVIACAAGYTFGSVFSLGSQVRQDSKANGVSNAGFTMALVTVSGVSTAGFIALGAAYMRRSEEGSLSYVRRAGCFYQW